MNYIEKLLTNVSIDSLKLTLLRTAYVKKGSFLAQFDPRIVILWYSIFAILPWFVHNTTVLLLFFFTMVIIASLSRISGFILVMLSFTTFCNLISIIVLTFFLGGDIEAFLAILTLTLKLVTVALASVAVFASLDPEKFSDALLSFGLPGQVSFGVSYGYRMIPILIEEYHQIINSYRLRGRIPKKKGFLRWRQLFYMGKIAVLAFYPMILNTAKRTRTTVEALEVKGFTYALNHPEAKKLKLSYLKVRTKDIVLLASTCLFLSISFYIGSIYPL
ncbi:energy-coupling factor transporter transmembrane component T family protein [Aquibacillus kalidii]|uniref:energy-coupling factor transporter transmembrane component T family protein n=1 Tax=Aquibacillus kalidii TaxID=2762597 RepID=UPI0016483DE3|nr:energy-coupling factor transporter transmembrane component T [Aquibacillus kalidii]